MFVLIFKSIFALNYFELKKRATTIRGSLYRIRQFYVYRFFDMNRKKVIDAFISEYIEFNAMNSIWRHDFNIDYGNCFQINALVHMCCGQISRYSSVKMIKFSLLKLKITKLTRLKHAHFAR